MVDFSVLLEITEEEKRVKKLYDLINEDVRLNRSKGARVEFLTSVHYIEQVLKEGDKILDLGAGAGEYSLYFAKKGYDVTALELSESNIRAFEKKIEPQMNLKLSQGNAKNLSAYADKSFDIVLLFGPLYHLEAKEDQDQCLKEAKRVCKDDGTIFIAYIQNDMVILTELMYDKNYLKSDLYDHDTFKVKNFPFVFFTIDKMRDMLTNNGFQIVKEVASDGVSELLEEKINQLDEISYEQYIKYHFHVCEKKEMLGYSNHLLFVTKKK